MTDHRPHESLAEDDFRALRVELAAERTRREALETANARLLAQLEAYAADLRLQYDEWQRRGRPSLVAQTANLRAELAEGEARADVLRNLYRRSIARSRGLSAQLLSYAEDLARLYRRKEGHRSRLLPIALMIPLMLLAFLAGALTRECGPPVGEGIPLAPAASAPRPGPPGQGTDLLTAEGSPTASGRVANATRRPVLVASSEGLGAARIATPTVVSCTCTDAVTAQPKSISAGTALPLEQLPGTALDASALTPIALPGDREGNPAAASPPASSRASPTGEPRVPLSVVPEMSRVEPAPGPVGATAVEIILDASGSMRDQLGRDTKISQAKFAVSRLLSTLPGGLSVGMRIYGHRIDGADEASCRDIELFHPVAPVNRSALVAAIASIQPQGRTPLARSLVLAAGDFPSSLRRGHIVAVTDGEETCGGDPVEVARKLQLGTPPLTVHVLGFGVAATERSRLEAIGQAGGGVYRDVSREADLQGALSSLIASVTTGAQ